MKKTLLSLLCVAMGVFATSAKEVVDELTATDFGIPSASAAYNDFTCTNTTSGAEYLANAYGKQDYIQLRSSGSTAGIVATKSGGKLISVSVEWNSTTAAARKVDVYGSSKAYTAPSALYDSSNAGTKIGQLTKSDGTQVLTAGADTDYQYVGIRPNSGALYIDKIIITWEVADGDDDTPQAARPVISPSGGEIFADTEISITSTTEDASIYYTYTPSDAATDFVPEEKLYEAPFTIDATGTVTAVAKKDGYLDSNEATAKFTVAHYIHLNSIKEMVDLNNTSDYMVLDNEVAVTVQFAKNIYVQDATGALCIYDTSGTLSFKNGDRLTGIIGKFVKYNTGSNGAAYLPELTNIDLTTFANPVEGDAVDPEELAIEDCAADKGASYVKIADVTITKDDTATGSYAANYWIIADETGSMTLYNSAGLEIKAGTATVTGVLTCYQGALQFTATDVEYATIAEPVKGDKEIPYTVAEVKEMYNADNDISKTGWITGYIVGCVNTTGTYTYEFAPDFDVTSNILIADEFDEDSFDNCVAVQLPSGSIRNALNLKDNAKYHRATVKLYGTIKKYFNTSGLSSPSDYEIVSEYVETQVCRPSITPAAGEITADTEITISCPTADATIYYAYVPEGVDAATVEKTVYTAPFTISASGSIVALAKKDGIADSKTVSVEYTVPEINNVATIAALIALDDTESYYAITGEVAVTFQIGKSIYVKDDTGYLCVYDAGGTLSLKNGDRLTGITGKFVKYNTGDSGSAYLPELTSIDASTFVPTDGEAVAPEELTVAEITADKAAAYVVVKGVTVAADETATGTNAAKYFTITDATGSMSLYNNYNNTVTATTGDATVDITGVVNVFSGALKLCNTTDVAESTGIDAVDNDAAVTVYGLVGAISVVGYEGTVEVYNTLGQLVAAAPVSGNALIPAHAGLAIVKAGNTVAKVIVK